MLTLFAAGAESLWDELFPEEVRVLPDDLARLDELLCDPELLMRSRCGGSGSWRRRAGSRIVGDRRWRWKPTCG